MGVKILIECQHGLYATMHYNNMWNSFSKCPYKSLKCFVVRCEYSVSKNIAKGGGMLSVGYVWDSI